MLVGACGLGLDVRVVGVESAVASVVELHQRRLLGYALRMVDQHADKLQILITAATVAALTCLACRLRWIGRAVGHDLDCSYAGLRGAMSLTSAASAAVLQIMFVRDEFSASAAMLCTDAQSRRSA